MAKLSVKRGATSVIVRVFLQDNTNTAGGGLTGLTSSSTNLQIAMLREKGSSATLYTGANIETITTIGTFAAPSSSSKIRFKAVDGTNMSGVYELHIHDSAANAFGTGDTSRFVTMYIFEITTTALNIVPNPIEIELTAMDNQDAVRGGMTALPNANAEAAGGLYTRGSGAGQINQAANGQVDVNAVKMNGTSLTARDVGASVLLSSGSGAGQLDFTSGVVKANATQILGTAVSTPATAGILDVNLKNIANAAVSTSSAQIGANAVNIGGTAQTGLDLGGNYTAARAAKLDNLDATTSSRLATSGYTAPNNTSIAAAAASAASADGKLGTPVTTIAGDIAEIEAETDDIAAIKVKTDLIPATPASTGDAMALTSGERNAVATALLDLADGVETGKTLRQVQRATAAILVGLVSGAGTGTEVFKAIGAAAGGTTRVTVTVDNDGNRSTVVLNL